MKNFTIKKYLKSLIFFVFLAQSPWANAYNPAADVNANWSEHSDRLVDKRISDETIIESSTFDPESADNKAFTDNRAGKVRDAEKYFQDIAYTSCETPADYTCPPLTIEKGGQDFRSRIDFIDLKNGEIGCSVYNAIGYGQSLNKTTETPIFKKKFINSACVEKYSTSKNIDKSDEIANLIEENEEFINSLQQQEFKYDVDYKMNGDDLFLDWADTLDALVTFNAEVFDLEQTLLTRSLKTRNGYTVLPNEIIIEKFEQNLSNLFFRVWNGGWDNNEAFVRGVEVQARVRNIADSMADSNYFMLLDFFIKSNALIIFIVTTLGVLFIGYNVLAGWVVPAIGNKILKKNSGENNIQRGIYGVLMLFMFMSTEVDVVNVEYEDYDGISREKIEIKQTRMQNAGQVLFTATNWFSDRLAKIGFDASSSALNASTGLLNKDQINALASERIILEKEKVALANIDIQMCAANYDLFNMIEILKQYREKTLNTKEGSENLTTLKIWETDGISSLRANPYPKSEREANAMMYNGYKNNESPYNTIRSSGTNGVVKPSAENKFRTSDYSPLSLSGCYNNMKRFIQNDSRIRAIGEEFDKFEDVEEKENKVEYLRTLNEIERKLFAEWGYPAISFLPVKTLLANNLGIVGDAMKKQEQLQEDMNSGEVFDGAMLKMIGSNITLLSVFGGYQIAQVIHTVKGSLLDLLPSGGPISTIISSFDKYMTAGNKEQQVDIIDLLLSSLILQASLETMVITVIVVGAAFSFTLLFVEKLFAFISLMFLVFYSFHKNQEEKVLGAIVKVFAVAFKTVLITTCIILSVFSLALVDKFEIVMLNEFFNSIDMIENQSWDYMFSEGTNPLPIISLFIKKYVFYSVSKVSFAILKIFLMMKIIFSMPAYLYELIYEKTSSVTDGIADSLIDATKQQTVKV